MSASGIAVRLRTFALAALVVVPLVAGGGPARAGAELPGEATTPTAEMTRLDPRFCDAYRATRVVTRVTNTSDRTIVIGIFADGDGVESQRSSLIAMEPGSTRRVATYLAAADTELGLWQVKRIWDPTQVRLLATRPRPRTMDCSSMDFRTSYGPQEPTACTVEQTLDNSRSSGPVYVQTYARMTRVEPGVVERITIPLMLNRGLDDFEAPTTFLSWSVRSAGEGSLGEAEEYPLTCEAPLPTEGVAGTFFDLGANPAFEATVVVPALARRCQPWGSQRRAPSYRLALGTDGYATPYQGSAVLSARCEEDGRASYQVLAETWGQSMWRAVEVGDVLAVRLDGKGVLVDNETSGERIEAIEELRPERGVIRHYRPRGSSVVDHTVDDVRVNGVPVGATNHRLLRSITTPWSQPLDLELVDGDTLRFTSVGGT